MTLYKDVSGEPVISPRAMREAEQWLGRLDAPGREAADQHEFERWRSLPQHAAAYRKVERLWQAFGQFPEHPEVLRLVAQTRAETAKGPQPHGRSHLTLALAASVAVCVLAGAAFVAGHYYVPGHTYTTEFGQRSTVQLDDGSHVILNSASRLTVRLGSDRREFRLKEGEAVFTVAEDPKRPFVVLAGDGEVTALGTRFQVRHEAHEVAVTLLEGRIAIDREDQRQHLQLRPGEQVIFVRDDAGLNRRAVDPEVILSWTTGRLRFKNTALADMLAEVNRYSKTQISLEDLSLAAMPINATLEMGNGDAAVIALQALLPVDASRRDRYRIVLTRRSFPEGP